MCEIFPEDYETNKDGSFVLTESGKPKKKQEDPRELRLNTIIQPNKRKIKLRQQKAKIQKEKKKLAKQEERLKTEEVITKVTEDTSSKLVTEDQLEETTDTIRDTIKDSKVIFHANEGPQTDFLAAGEKDVLYGGQQVVVSPMLCLLTH